MTDKRTQQQADHSNMEKDPGDWVTGDEPMTGAQRSYLKTLSEEAREAFDDTLTKAQASMRIEELQARTGRGSGAAAGHAGAQAEPASTDTVAPKEDAPLESLGRAASEVVLGSEPPDADGGAGRR